MFTMIFIKKGSNIAKLYRRSFMIREQCVTSFFKFKCEVEFVGTLLKLRQMFHAMYLNAFG